MHQHGHDHPHGHSHGSRGQNQSRLAWTLALTAGYMLAEAIGGWWSDSLALMADAGHMLSDAAALGLSLFAIWIAGRPPTPEHSYGYYRAEILAALANGTALVAISIVIIIEACGRIGAPHEVQGAWMLGIATGGLLVNLVGMLLLHAGRDDNLNIRGAWLHLLTDALGSVAALVAGGLIWARGWTWADPAASILIALLVVYSAWSLLKEAIAILMQRTPSRLDMEQVQAALSAVAGVREVHDLHIWSITGGMDSLSAHVVLDSGCLPRDALSAIRTVVHDRFGIDHITIQIEPDDAQDCGMKF